MALTDVFSQEEIDTLSDEERAALEEEFSNSQKTSTNTAESSSETETTEGEGETATETETQTASETAGQEAGQEAGSETTGPVSTEEGTDAQETTSEAQPSFEAESQEASTTADQEQQDPNAQKKQELQDQLKLLREQFEEGEISFEDYLDQRDQVNDQIREFDFSAKIRQEIEEREQERQRLTLEQQWESDVQKLVSNSDIGQDSGLYQAFAQQVNVKLDNPEYASVTNQDLLEEAAKEARAIKGVAQPSQDNAVAQARQEANKGSKEQAVQHQSLSGVPTAAEHEGRDEFAYLNDLLERGEGEKLEEEIAKLPFEKAERYLVS